MSFARKIERTQKQRERKAFRQELVKEGKRIVFNPQTNKLEIVEVKKPYRKE